MKRILLLGSALFLLIVLVGCGQHDAMTNGLDVIDLHEEESNMHYEQGGSTGIEASWAVDELRFSSVEDLLNAYVITRAGGEIEHLVSEWQELFVGTDISFADSAANVGFTALENLHLPVGIPEELELFTIMINKGLVEFTFMHPEDMVSEEAVRDAIISRRVARFSFRRWDMDDDFLFDAMMNQSTQRDVLIDGKYRFREDEMGAHSFSWVYDRTRFWLHLPAQRSGLGPRIAAAPELGGVPLDDPYAMVSFTETVTINLQDTRAVEAMIEELAAQ